MCVLQLSLDTRSILYIPDVSEALCSMDKVGTVITSGYQSARSMVFIKSKFTDLIIRFDSREVINDILYIYGDIYIDWQNITQLSIRHSVC